MSKFTYKKFNGDDLYSWAVFRDGRPVMTGMSRSEAKHTKERLEREHAAAKQRTVKRMVAEVYKNPDEESILATDWENP